MEASSSSDKPRSRVSFRIFAAGLDPDHINLVLGLMPDHTHIEGDYPRDNPKYSPYKHGMWALRSKLASEEPFSAHLESLLSILEPKQKQILKLSEDNAVDFFCSLFSQSGFELSSHLLSQIANLGASLGVDIYPADEMDKDENTPNGGV